MNYLISVAETWRVPDDAAADAMEQEFRAENNYELNKWATAAKVRKQNGEIVEEWVQVKTVKVFNLEREPETNVRPTYK